MQTRLVWTPLHELLTAALTAARLRLPLCLLFFLPVSLLTACQIAATPFQPTATAMPLPSALRFSPTPTRTATIVWFPTRTTPTRPAQPSLQPTSDQRPAVGELVWRDLFDDPAEWQLSSAPAGSVTISRRELTFALVSPRELFTSLRKSPPPADFYLEVTTNAALCRADDAYGVLFRAASAREGYRLLLNCRGEMRLERMRGGEVIPLEDWAPSTVLPGAPMTTRLGIWVVKNEFRIFANDLYQFSSRDPLWTAGQVGLFARSGANSPLTVSFSDLTVRAVNAARVPTITPTQPTSTATPRRSP